MIFKHCDYTGYSLTKQISGDLLSRHPVVLKVSLLVQREEKVHLGNADHHWGQFSTSNMSCWYHLGANVIKGPSKVDVATNYN